MEGLDGNSFNDIPSGLRIRSEDGSSYKSASFTRRPTSYGTFALSKKQSKTEHFTGSQRAVLSPATVSGASVTTFKP